MSGVHARLAPSAAGMWGPGACPAYPRVSAAYPADEDSEEAREGTAAHWYVTESLRGVALAEGAIAPNGHPVTAEMIRCARQMIARVNEMCPDPAQRIIETWVPVPAVHRDCSGTPDFACIDRAAKVLRVYDYKYGHREIEVYECWQLVAYGAGVAFSKNIDLTDGWRVEMKIFQPRCFSKRAGPEDTLVLPGNKMIMWINRLRAAAHETDDEKAPRRSGEYCRDCPAMLECPAALAAIGEAMCVSRRGPECALTAEDRAHLLTYVRAAMGRLKAADAALSASVTAALKSGRPAPGWYMEKGRSSRKWARPAAEVIATAALCGVDVCKADAAVTPLQALEKGLDEAVVDAYSVTAPGAPILKPFTGIEAAKAFANI